MKLVDSHFHTQSMLERGMDVFSIFDEFLYSGIDIGCVHDDLPARSEILKNQKNIKLSAAMGPWEAGISEIKGPDVDFPYGSSKDLDQLDKELSILRENIIKFNASFIGEIGLDYYWEYGNHEKQQHLFHTQLTWADEMGMKVIIHDRDVDEDVIKAIIAYGPSKGGIIHCCNGNPALISTALEHGYYLGFAGNITYGKNNKMREALKSVPKNKILLETDSPYLTPVPHRGEPNHPGMISHTYKCAAETLGITIEEMSELVKENFETFCNS